MRRPVEQRAMISALGILGLSLPVWWFGTDGSAESLRETLFLLGTGSIVFGVLFVCGAWRGLRDVDVDYILGPSPERSAKLFADIKRAYSDLNALAMAGCGVIIFSLLL